MAGRGETKTQEATAPNYTSDNAVLVEHDYNQTMVGDPGVNDINQIPDHLGASIFATLCCCVCLGIFAIIKSTECRAAKDAGNYDVAKKKSKETSQIMVSAVLVGTIFVFVGAGLQIVALQMHWYAQQNQNP